MLSHLKTPVTVREPLGTYTDGKPNHAERPAKALFLEFTQADLDVFGAVQDGRIALLSPDAAPSPGCQIVLEGGKTLDVAKARACVNHAGEVVAWRCAVAGGTVNRAN